MLRYSILYLPESVPDENEANIVATVEHSTISRPRVGLPSTIYCINVGMVRIPLAAAVSNPNRKPPILVVIIENNRQPLITNGKLYQLGKLTRKQLSMLLNNVKTC
jgi:hypothetical protein